MSADEWIYGWQDLALKKWLVLHFVEPSSIILVNHVVFEQVMKFLGLKGAVIYPNDSVLGVLYMLLSLT